ncbi:MAG: hypothetical protein ACFE8J_02400 [Candidatus Heimdallarchaeota archaeon]
MAKDLIRSDIVILGHIAKDIIEVDGVSTPSLGGGVYYGGIAGAHMGLKVTIITRLKKEDFPILDIFRIKGIRYYAYPSEETSGLKNIYSSKNVEFRNYEPLGFAGLFRKEEIPDIKTKYFVIGPIIAGEIDVNLLNHLSERYKEKLCLDIQGFIRIRENKEIIYRELDHRDKIDIISKVKVLKVDQTEAEILTGQKDINKASEELIELGPSEILLTHERGITVNAESQIYFFPWKNKNSIGRTGRGDTAFISYLGSRITKSPDESLKFAAALTSLKMESIGPFSLTLYAVEDLVKKEY